MEQYESSSSSNSTDRVLFNPGEWCEHHKAVKVTIRAQFKSLKSMPKETQENHDFLVLKVNFVFEEVL